MVYVMNMMVSMMVTWIVSSIGGLVTDGRCTVPLEIRCRDMMEIVFS